MLIKNLSIDLDKRMENELGEYGIKEAKRKLMLFIDKNEYNMGILTTGKAVLMNLVACQDTFDNGIINMINKGNSTTVKVNMYVFDVVFECGLENIRDAYFTLQNAYSTEITQDWSTMLHERPDIGIYNRDFSTSEAIKEKITQDPFRCSCLIPLPIYYTALQQRHVTKDIFTIIWLDFIIHYSGGELIDKLTTIEVYDLSTWDSMVPMLKQKIEEAQNLKNSSANLLNRWFIPATESIIHGYNFIYDTQDGSNITTVPGVTSVPFSKYRDKSILVDDLQYIIDDITISCKKIEKEYGSIRLYFTPFLQGDRLHIYFKDYNNTPKEFTSTSLDNGYSAQEELTYRVSEYLRDEVLLDDGE
jgi:hypothetical protein